MDNTHQLRAAMIMFHDGMAHLVHQLGAMIQGHPGHPGQRPTHYPSQPGPHDRLKQPSGGMEYREHTWEEFYQSGWDLHGFDPDGTRAGTPRHPERYPTRHPSPLDLAIEATRGAPHLARSFEEALLRGPDYDQMTRRAASTLSVMGWLIIGPMRSSDGPFVVRWECSNGREIIEVCLDEAFPGVNGLLWKVQTQSADVTNLITRITSLGWSVEPPAHGANDTIHWTCSRGGRHIAECGAMSTSVLAALLASIEAAEKSGTVIGEVTHPYDFPVDTFVELNDDRASHRDYATIAKLVKPGHPYTVTGIGDANASDFNSANERRFELIELDGLRGVLFDSSMFKAVAVDKTSTKD